MEPRQQIQDFSDAFPRENVVASENALVEAQISQKKDQVNRGTRPGARGIAWAFGHRCGLARDLLQCSFA